MADLLAPKTYTSAYGLNNNIEEIEPRSPHVVLQEFREKYPSYELYRLFVDGLQYSLKLDKDIKAAIPPEVGALKQRGWLQYEWREPGCLEALFKALDFALEDIEDENLTVDYIKKIHRLCTEKVAGELYENNPGQFRSGKPESHIKLHIPIVRTTPQGIFDLLQYIIPHPQLVCESWNQVERELLVKADNLNFILEKTGTSSLEELANYIYTNKKWLSYSTFNHADADENFIADEIQKIIDGYKSEIKKTKSSHEKFIVIGETIQSFERLHPFRDANGRVFANILLIRLLIQNGFPPPTLLEPNLFDIFSHFPEVLAQGIANTEAIYRGEHLFGFNTKQKMTFKDIGAFNEILGKAKDTALSNLFAEISKEESELVKQINSELKPSYKITVRYQPSDDSYQILADGIDVPFLISRKTLLQNSGLLATEQLQEIDKPFTTGFVDKIKNSFDNYLSTLIKNRALEDNLENIAKKIFNLNLNKFDPDYRFKFKEDFLNKLINALGSVNAIDARGNTLLHYATKYDDPYAVQVLIQKGAISYRKNNKHKTPKQIAIKHNKFFLWSLLEKRQIKTDSVEKLYMYQLSTLDELINKAKIALNEAVIYFLETAVIFNMKIEHDHQKMLAIFSDKKELMQFQEKYPEMSCTANWPKFPKQENNLLQPREIPNAIEILLKLKSIVEKVSKEESYNVLEQDELTFLIDLKEENKLIQECLNKSQEKLYIALAAHQSSPFLKH